MLNYLTIIIAIPEDALSYYSVKQSNMVLRANQLNDHLLFK